MKSLSTIFVLFLFSCTGNLFSQVGYGNNQGGYGNGQGSLGNKYSDSQIADYKTRMEEDNSKARKIAFDKMLAKMKTDLKLDELQFFAVQKTLADSDRDQNIILKKEIPQEDKISQLIAINSRTDIEINSYLSKEQKEKYKIFNEDKNKRIEKLKEEFQK